jgi:hypothetical protein
VTGHSRLLGTLLWESSLTRITVVLLPVQEVLRTLTSTGVAKPCGTGQSIYLMSLFSLTMIIGRLSMS